MRLCFTEGVGTSAKSAANHRDFGKIDSATMPILWRWWLGGAGRAGLAWALISAENWNKNQAFLCIIRAVPQATHHPPSPSSMLWMPSPLETPFWKCSSFRPVRTIVSVRSRNVEKGEEKNEEKEKEKEKEKEEEKKEEEVEFPSR